MTLSKIERLKRLLNEIDTTFQESEEEELYWCGPCSKKLIDKAERILGVPLPKTYREFLALKGCGGIESFIISGINPEFALDDGGLIVQTDSDYYREDWVPGPLPKHLLVIQKDDDDNEPFCLDTSRMKRGECPVVLYYHHKASGYFDEIAPDFVSFYEKYMGSYLS